MFYPYQLRRRRVATVITVIVWAVLLPCLMIHLSSCLRPNDPSDTSVPPFDTTLPNQTDDDISAFETDPPETDPPVTEPLVFDPLLEETPDAGLAYQDKIIFFGDSTTYSLLAYGVLTDGKETKQVWTPASRTLTLEHAPTTTILYPDTGEEITVKEAVARKKPEIMVITLGVNGISFMNEEYFTVMYKKLIGQIQEASPETKIILQSIFPVAAHWEKMDSINNDKIRAANGWILKIAEDTGVRYLDTISVLAVAEGGYLPYEYQNGDGLHLKENSLAIVLNYIRTHALPEYVPASGET